MGFIRFLMKQTIPGYSTVNTIKNIVDEGGVSRGVKRTLKEDFYEDNPITSTFYKIGKNDGKQEGYVEASKVYELKLRSLTEMFLNQKKVYDNQVADYEMLLNDYEALIDELQQKYNRTQEENEYLNLLLINERNLRKIR